MEFRLKNGGRLALPPDAIRSVLYNPADRETTLLRVGGHLSGEKTIILDHLYRDVVDTWIRAIGGRVVRPHDGPSGEDRSESRKDIDPQEYQSDPSSEL